MWTIFKVFIEFVTVLLLFYVLVLWTKICGILAPPPGIESSPPILEGKVLTAGLQGKSILMLPPNDAFLKNLLECSLFMSFYYFPGIQQSESVIHIHISTLF